MEELFEIARAHYGAGSPEVQSLAYEFFKSLDTNGDGSVQLHEFLAFMGSEGHSRIPNTHFFHELDRDHNGTLDFWEVMALYYIIKSGRPFCNWCGEFIPGVFFCCVACFHSPCGPFTLCLKCYKSKNCQHNHDDRVQFLDNYTLLEYKRTSVINQNQPSPSQQSGTMVPPPRGMIPFPSGEIPHATWPLLIGGRPQVGIEIPLQSGGAMWRGEPPHVGRGSFLSPLPPRPIVASTNTQGPTYSYVAYPPNSSSNTSNAIVPASSAMDKWKAALKAFEIALSIGNIATTVCTIL